MAPAPAPGLETQGTPGRELASLGFSSHVLTAPINSSAAKHNRPLSLLRRSCLGGTRVWLCPAALGLVRGCSPACTACPVPVPLPLFSASHSRDLNPNTWAAVAQEGGLFYTV